MVWMRGSTVFEVMVLCQKVGWSLVHKDKVEPEIEKLFGRPVWHVEESPITACWMVTEIMKSQIWAGKMNLLGNSLWMYSKHVQLRAHPRTRWRLYISHLPWEHLGIQLKVQIDWWVGVMVFGITGLHRWFASLCNSKLAMSGPVSSAHLNLLLRLSLSLAKDRDRVLCLFTLWCENLPFQSPLVTVVCDPVMSPSLE